jgi:hypothetical protein
VRVVPREGSDLVSPEKGAFVNFLTLASSDSEYRAKVIGALSYYRLELLEFDDVRPYRRLTGHQRRFWLSPPSWKRAGNHNDPDPAAEVWPDDSLLLLSGFPCWRPPLPQHGIRTHGREFASIEPLHSS